MKRICIVADIKGWAFDNIAHQVKKDLGAFYDIDIAYFNRHDENADFYTFVESLNDYDLVHFLNRRMLLLMNSEKFIESVENSGRDIKSYIQEKKRRFSTAVYDYLDFDPKGIENQTCIFNDFTKKYYVSTQGLFEIYNKINEYKKPYSVVHDVCDCDFYKPSNLDRFKLENIKDRELVIGWCGNSTHSADQVVDLKGINHILNPVVAELQSEGYNIKSDFADRNVNFKQPEEMPAYYSNIDIYVCASIHEGTPRPVLESMSCGVPIISTNVGIVPECFGPLQKSFIIGDRMNGKNDEEVRKNLKDRIIYLYNNRELFEILSNENMRSLQIFDGGKTMQSFKEFFDACLKED